MRRAARHHVYAQDQKTQSRHCRLWKKNSPALCAFGLLGAMPLGHAPAPGLRGAPVTAVNTAAPGSRTLRAPAKCPFARAGQLLLDKFSPEPAHL
jgi:hypothetical protein